jgi:hypothetical protein
MEERSIAAMVLRRNYDALRERAKWFIASDNWPELCSMIQYAGAIGKGRDAIVHLLGLQPVGGTDSDVFNEFSYIEGSSLSQIQANAVAHAIEILRNQIKEKHTFFMNIEEMTLSPFAVLVNDVIEARKNELKNLQQNASRINVVSTYYGFMILLASGSQLRDSSSQYRYWRRCRTWLDENITDDAFNAIRNLTKEYGQQVDMDKRYRTLGSNTTFKKICSPDTAKILSDLVRLALYKSPGNRARAATDIGNMEDSRALPFMHNLLMGEPSRNVRYAIGKALGRIGHDSSIPVLKKLLQNYRRQATKESRAYMDALGNIDSPLSREALVGLLKEGNNSVKAGTIKALSNQTATELLGIIRPYLMHKSRPVVRSAVNFLLAQGRNGEDIIIENVERILRKLGTDKSSKSTLARMMEIKTLGEMQVVHKYFAKRINKLNNHAKNWLRTRTTGHYSYYYSRYIRRAKRDTEEWLRLASRNLCRPFDEDLATTIRTTLETWKGTDYPLTLGSGDITKIVRT